MRNLSNVINHSLAKTGYILGQIHKNRKHIAFCIFDGGQGIYNSLRNSEHRPRNPLDAITLAIREGVTRDKSIGQGNGMWGLHRIIEDNSGSLTITTGSASYFMQNRIPKTYNHIPCFSNENQCTTIDFQIEYNKEISIKKALGGYEVINLRVDNLENDLGELVYKVAEKANGTGTRDSGSRLRYEILNLYKESGKVIVIDFATVAVVSSSFADEMIGKLYVELGILNFNQIIRLKNMNETIQSIVQRSVAQRIVESYSSTKQ